MPKNLVGLYAGTGAVMAVDVEVVLTNLDIPFIALDEGDVSGDRYMRLCKALIMPGGYTEQCLRHLSIEDRKSLREFVARGGGYVGICLGAYMAPKIGIVKTKMKRGRGLRQEIIRITNPDHPIFRGEKRDVLTTHYQNGPLMTPGDNEQSLAVYEMGPTAILSARYGRGNVVLFSPHPEKKPDTTQLLLNAIDFCCGESRF